MSAAFCYDCAQVTNGYCLRHSQITIVLYPTPGAPPRTNADSVFYCRQCICIVTTLAEKALHERIHGHSMEIPAP